MDSIDNYIEKVKKETEGFTEDEVVRYVYMNLGQRLSFNLEFSFGNSKKKREIYSNNGRRNIAEQLKTNIIICKSASYILERILKAMGVNIETKVVPEDYRKCAHMFNVVKPKDGREAYKIDLQTDLENIQSHTRTKEFGKSERAREISVISRDELERIDRKIGYIKNDYYYADEYLDLLKMNMRYFSDFREKVEFVLQNIDIYHNKEMKYAERKWHHETVIRELFTEEEQKQICVNDCYRITPQGKEYVTCISLTIPKKGTSLYMFSVEDNNYREISVEELAHQVQEGLIVIQTIPILKVFLKKQEKNNGR